jgi:hypothetical protein
VGFHPSKSANPSASRRSSMRRTFSTDSGNGASWIRLQSVLPRLCRRCQETSPSDQGRVFRRI